MRPLHTERIVEPASCASPTSPGPPILNLCYQLRKPLKRIVTMPLADLVEQGDVVRARREHRQEVVHPAQVELADRAAVPLLDQKPSSSLRPQAPDDLVLRLAQPEALDV